jgi:hypothetical protein
MSTASVYFLGDLRLVSFTGLQVVNVSKTVSQIFIQIFEKQRKINIYLTGLVRE